MKGLLACLLCVGAGTAALADASKAKKLNADGMALYKKKDYSGALAQFDKALAEDAAFVLAHYNAASMASLLGENERVIQELEWLQASKDPAAAKALTQGQKDSDLDRAVMHPRVRALVGVPALGDVPIADLALERGGVWGVDGEACGMAAATLTFKKGGGLAIHTEWGCDANEDTKSEAGTWAVKNGKLVLTSKTMFAGGKAAHVGKCESLEDGTFCLNAELDQEGSFHRGAGALH